MTERGDVGAVQNTAPVLVRDAETYGKIDSRVVSITNPASAAAEQYRLLAVRLEAAARAGMKRIAITSATVGEGRTITAVNTAIALGRGQRNRVALVDCNFRSPGTHTALGLSPTTGLADVVTGKASLDSVLWRFGDDDLFVVPAGHCAEPHVTIGSRRLGEAITELSNRNDIVLIDAPPVMPTADVQAMARHIDAVVLVIRAGETPRDVINLALGALADVHILGCVLVGIEQEAGTTYRLLRDHDRRQRMLPAHRGAEG